MNEITWLSSKDPQEMLRFLRGQSERKLRLFACACCRRLWKLLDNDSRRAIEVAERFADGMADELERSTVAYLVNGDDLDVDEEELDSPQRLAQVAASWAIQADQECEEEGDLDPETENFAILTAKAVVDATRPKKREAIAQCELLREIFGNPFRKLRIKKAWRQKRVVAIARTIYDEQAFDQFATLADSLQSAGCDNKELLDHCRNSGTHVRGCWVLDLVLGNE